MDFLKEFSNSAGGWAAAIASALIGLAVYLPKISNGMKSDKVDGNILDRVLKLEVKAEQQDKKIHKQAVRITKLVVLVIRLEGILMASGTQIPDTVRDEIMELTKDEDLGE